jgi:F-type H+-transporting ATPase subunit b
MEGIGSLGINVSTLIAQVVNVAILFGLLYLVAYRPIMRMLDERSRKIKESMDNIEHIKQQAERAEGEAAKRIEAAAKEGQEAIARAMRTGEEVRQGAQQKAKIEGEALIARARAEIQQERDEAIVQLRESFADITIQAAGKVIDRTLDKKAHRDIIDRVLKESTTLKKG